MKATLIPFVRKLLSTLLILSWLFTNVCADTVAIGEIFQRDTNRPIYQVYLPSIGEYEPQGKPLPDELPVGVTSMKMVTARGQVMNCILPAPQPAENFVRSSRTSSENQFDDIDDLMKPFEKSCFSRAEGWWTYEFCYGKHVVQKHIISPNRDPQPDEVEQTFVLGRYDRDTDLVHRKNISTITTPDATFTQLFINGTVCDVTNQPRKVLVKYLCSDEALQLTGGNRKATSKLNFLKGVREIESCVYEVEFMNGAICEHSTYREKMSKSTRPIHCSLESDQTPFEGLTSNVNRKTSLNL